MKWKKMFFLFFTIIFFTGCARNFYYNKPLNAYLPTAFKTSRRAVYNLAPAPKGSFYLVSFKDAFFWENGVSWKVIVFNNDLSSVYITFAFDADGDGFLESLVPVEYYGMKFLLVSHDNLVMFGPSFGIGREKKQCLIDLKWEEILKKAPILGNDTGYLISDASSMRQEIISKWRMGMENNLICKVLTPRQISDLRCWAPSAEWWKIVNVIANVSGIYGIWDSSVWGLGWFKWLRTAVEGNALMSNILRCPDNSMYGTSNLSRLEGADLMWAFDKYKERKPGFFRKIYLERGGS